ncbi:MAG: AAA family ATPase [Anaerolineae bacterium]|nr:AAA family ATPase [Anaerolineae bacterium]
MTVKAIRLQNFMPFADTDWIELRPITLLFGRNSSGKSAIIRALRLLKQSLTTHGQSLRFVADHGVDLGSFQTAVHQQKDNLTISFSFRCHIPKTLDNLRPHLNQWREADQLLPFTAQEMEAGLGLRLGFGWNRDQDFVELTEVQLDCLWLAETESMLFFAQRLDFVTASELGYEWWFDSHFTPVQQMDWTFAAVETPSGFLPTLVGFQEFNPEVNLPLTEVLEQTGKSVADFLEGIEFLGPVRPKPQRAYLLNEAQRDAWRQEGLSAFVDFLDNKIDATRLREIDHWLDYLQLAEKIVDPKSLFASENITLSQIRLQENSSNELEVNLLDMGYGATQVLPIIVQSVAVRQSVSQEQPIRWIVIEQPELHLHPRAQARLADLFVDSVYVVDEKRDERGQISEVERRYSGINFLLETHSEHLLLRLQKRVTETTLGRNHHLVAGRNRYLRLKDEEHEEDLRIWFTERPKHIRPVTIIEPITLNNLGEFDDFPEEFETFFADDLLEAGELAKLRLEARSRRNKTLGNSGA